MIDNIQPLNTAQPLNSLKRTSELTLQGTGGLDWVETTLGEVCIFNYGKGLITENRIFGNIPVYGSSGITGWHNESLINEKGLIIGRKGSVGTIYKSEVPFYPIDTTYYITQKDIKCDLEFLYRLLQSLGLDKKNSDSAVPGLNRENAYSTEILLPPLPEQVAIASILSAFDDKIELLREQNKTLEEMGQVIFQEWFGKYGVDDELPEEWRVGTIIDFKAEITDYVANGSFASLKENVTLYDTENYALFLRNTDLKSNFTQKVYVDEKSYNFLKKTQMHGGEIIISNVGDVGSVYFCPFLKIPMVLGNNVICLKSKYQSYFYTLFTNRIGQHLISSITAGSAQPKFNKTDFRNMKLIVPDQGILKQFDEVMQPIFAKIRDNSEQIQSLARSRDELLPRFMGGEVRVNF